MILAPCTASLRVTGKASRIFLPSRMKNQATEAVPLIRVDPANVRAIQATADAESSPDLKALKKALAKRPI